MSSAHEPNPGHSQEITIIVNAQPHTVTKGELSFADGDSGEGEH